MFASGSPFPAVDFENQHLVPGQGNNAYIFPGVGLGVLASGARRVTDEMFFGAAEALAAEVTRSDLDQGRVYPPLDRIREVSSTIAARVAEIAYDHGLTDRPRPEDVLDDVRAQMFDPVYADYA